MTEPDTPSSVSKVNRFFFVRLPTAAARRGPGSLLIAGDGHWLTAFGSFAGLATAVSGLVGVAVGWRHFGFEIATTESTTLIAALLVLGVAGTQFSTAFLAGFMAGDFFLFHTSWWSSAPARYDGGLEQIGLFANIWYERIPLVAHYLLIAALVIGVPAGARALISGLSDRVQGRADIVSFIIAVLVAVAVYVLARFWTAAAPHVIRPLFTWAPPWLRGTVPPLDAVAPVQNNPAIPRAGAAAVFVRTALIVISSRRQSLDNRISAVEIEAGNAILDLGPMPPPSTRRKSVHALLGSVAGIVLLIGLLERLSTALIVGVCFFVIRLAKVDVIPFPTQRWREVVNQIPVVLRFGAALLIISGISQAVVGQKLDNSRGLEFLVWPMVAALAVMTVLLPDLSARRPPAPAGAESGVDLDAEPPQ